ncbi:MAG: cupin domain-containing protein [Gemmatales bacterium]|nr:cupin domain-containing protein [Gemmatales bacterium]MDW8387599.1 cupin domain-containing protein [Gemmatales bacterium]
MLDYFPNLETAPRREIFPGVYIRTCSLDRVMLSLVDLEPGSVVPEHHHPHEQMGYWLRGKARFTIGGDVRIIEPGQWYRIPSNVPHKVEVLHEPAQALDVFSPPREEYR